VRRVFATFVKSGEVRDIDTLERWIVQAAVAQSVAEVFSRG